MKKSKITTLLLGVVAVLLIGGYLFQRLQVTNHLVVLTEKGFVPKNITIKRNDTITFTTTRPFPFWPASDSHPSHSRYPAFDPKTQIEQDAQWTFTFTEVGEWNYHDHLNSTLRGIISVVN